MDLSELLLPAAVLRRWRAAASALPMKIAGEIAVALVALLHVTFLYLELVLVLIGGR